MFNVGFLSPGHSPGQITINGDYDQLSQGTLVVQIAGTAAGQFDLLSVGGSAILGGTLELSFIDGFAPRAGDSFAFLNVGGSTDGSFSTFLVQGLADGWQYELASLDGTMKLLSLTDGVAVPEPTSILLLAMAFGAIVAYRLPGPSVPSCA